MLTSTKSSQLQKKLTHERCQYQDIMKYSVNLGKKFAHLEKMSVESEQKLQVLQKENSILEETVGGSMYLFKSCPAV
jgi:5-bromo-4-chloroindolyl phosphate hydrolysis protein